MTLYNIIHGPEAWLMIAQVAIGLMLFNAGLLAGMWLAALFGRDDDHTKK